MSATENNAKVEYNVYGLQQDDKPMMIGRVVTVGNVRAGVEDVATFKTNDDGAQFAQYLDQLRTAAIRYDMLIEKFKEGDIQAVNTWLRRFSDAK